MTAFLFRLLCLSLLSVTPLLAREAGSPAPPFPHEGSDLKPDPEAKFGALANGFRYVIRPNHEPKGRASLRLLVDAGSLNETDEQRGLAHFLEHMAFNGSEHYPAGTLVEFFQRMGMSFGGDTNASTSFDNTIYKLELAHPDDASLTEGLRVFGDYAGGLLLGEAEIDKERGVILSEKRARDSVEYRTGIAHLKDMFGSTLVSNRVPIGELAIISNASRERFTDFWNTWYRPEKMVAVIVGDFADPAAVEKMVTSAFGNLKPRTPARPAPSLGEFPKFEGIRPTFHPEAEAGATTILLTNTAPYVREPDSAARQIKRIPRDLAVAMLNRRFSILAQKEGAPFTNAGLFVMEEFDFLREATVGITCKPEQWRAALAVGEQELRRALEHGFTTAELREAVANRLNELEQAVKTAATRHSDRIADEIVQNLLDGEVFTTPAADLALGQPALEKITPQDCLAALRKNFGANERLVTVTGNVSIPGDPAAAITTAYEQSRAVAVAPPPNEKNSAWAYTDFGPAGEIVKREHIADLDIELVTFKNGVRLNLKKTDFEAGRLSLVARVGNGTITEPPGERGLAAIAARTFIAGGLGKHSADDLRDIFAGKNVGWQFAPDFDAFRFGGATTPDELPLQLQWLCAELTDPGYRAEALRVAQKEIEQMYLSFQHTPGGPMATEIANLIASGDPRFGMPPRETMLARNLDEVKAWLGPQLTRGALEVGIAGDIDIEATIAASAKTIGALPLRETRPALDNLKKVHFPAPPFAKDYAIDSEIPKGALVLYWPTDDAKDARRNRRLNVLAAILNDRLRVKVREEIGASYTAQAVSVANDVFPGYGFIKANIDVDPPGASKLVGLVRDIGDDLAQHGVSDDELNRARQPLLTSLRESARTNGYWISAVLNRAQEKPEVLDWARTRIADTEAITPDEISALAKKYLGGDRVSRATILPGTKIVQAAPQPTEN